MTVSTLASTPAATTPPATVASAAAQALAATQASFYTLLVAQLQYQDPTNPMDNSQMTSQLAQMNTVSGINQLNSTVSKLATTIQGSQAMQSASLLGKTVLVPGTGLQLSQGRAIFGANFEQAFDNANVTIKNSAGTTVRTMALGAESAGVQNFTWNGTTNAGTTAPDGSYTFSLQASQSAQPVMATMLSSGLVQSIAVAASGLTLNLLGLGNVPLTNVQQVQ